MSISARKTALVHLARKRLALTDDDYRAILKRVAGVASAKDLDDSRFDWVMAAFQQLGFESDMGKANLGNRAGMASPAQVAAIRKLWQSFTGGQGTDASLGVWLERQFKVSSIRFLTHDLAYRATGALKVMTGKRARAAGEGQ